MKNLLKRSRIWDLIIAEESARSVPVTKVFKRTNIILDKGKYRLAKLKGKGNIKEFLLISNSPNYKISIIINNTVIFDDRFDNLRKLSLYLGLLDVITNENEFIFHLSNLEFNNNFEIILELEEKITFKTIYLIYNIHN